MSSWFSPFSPYSSHPGSWVLLFKTGIMWAGKSQTLMSDYGFFLYSWKYGSDPETTRISVFNSSIATGLYGDAIVRSRTGMYLKCTEYGSDFSFLDFYQSNYAVDTNGLSSLPAWSGVAFMVDESQFLSRDQVFQLLRLSEEFGVDVVCYGLKTDFRSEFFEWSEWLLRMAHRIETLRSVECWCGRPAVANARIVSDTVVHDGPTVLAWGDDRYVPLCHTHYVRGQLCQSLPI